MPITFNISLLARTTNCCFWHWLTCLWMPKLTESWLILYVSSFCEHRLWKQKTINFWEMSCVCGLHCKVKWKKTALCYKCKHKTNKSALYRIKIKYVVLVTSSPIARHPLWLWCIRGALTAHALWHWLVYVNSTALNWSKAQFFLMISYFFVPEVM